MKEKKSRLFKRKTISPFPKIVGNLTGIIQFPEFKFLLDKKTACNSFKNEYKFLNATSQIIFEK